MGYELYHHGILGMKWGVRRFQNKDGSLTSAGKKRYGLNKEIYEAEKRDRRENPKSTHKTDLHQRPGRIAYSMHLSGVEIFNEEDQKEIRRIKDKIHEYSEATMLSAAKELDQASSNPEFKKELDEYLHHEFGNDYDGVDNDYFQLTVLDGISDVISSNKKYYPETIENDRKLKAAAEEMFNFVDKKVNSYVSEFGDEPLSRYKNDDSKYSDVVKNLIHEEAHNQGLNYLYRNNLSTSILELTYDGAIDPDDYYTFEEYKKKYGGKK